MNGIARHALGLTPLEPVSLRHGSQKEHSSFLPLYQDALLPRPEVKFGAIFLAKPSFHPHLVTLFQRNSFGCSSMLVPFRIKLNIYSNLDSEQSDRKFYMSIWLYPLEVYD